jgi:hypothetical protein
MTTTASRPADDGDANVSERRARKTPGNAAFADAVARRGDLRARRSRGTALS